MEDQEFKNPYRKYVCRKCNYKFQRKEDFKANLKCPYCGSTGVEENTFDVNQVIKESQSSAYDF